MKKQFIGPQSYPRPQFVRESWQNLDGKWKFRFDKDESGKAQNFQNGFESDATINVPFAYQTQASGIGDATLCKQLWYERRIDLRLREGERALLHFEGSDYMTEVWLNGVFCGKDEGGYHRETFDITSAAKQGANLLVVAVYDDYSEDHPRGKQRAKDHDYGCWYVDTSGIFKTVWLEVVPSARLENVKMTPSVKNSSVNVEYEFVGDVVGKKIRTEIFFEGALVAQDVADAKNGYVRDFSLQGNVHLWQLGEGKTYDVAFSLEEDGNVVDKVTSYFGLREITIDNARVLLNGKPLYQKLILDQGYWKGSDLTAPSDEALEQDLLFTMQMGFNGARKHEKVEDERFLYYADKHGFIVWAEMPSMYRFVDYREGALAEFKRQWLLAVRQQYNHPCVFTWVPFNESWGVEQIRTDKEQQDFVNDVYFATKKVDTMRPVVTNDGWEHTLSDLLTIHHYTQSGETLKDCFDTVEKCVAKKFAEHERGAFCDGYEYKGQPILLTEFGGTSFVKDISGNNWGYGESVRSDEEFLQRFSSLVAAIDGDDHMCGYCYTQLTDVYHEVNGLLDFDRKPKLPLEKIRHALEKNGK